MKSVSQGDSENLKINAIKGNMKIFLNIINGKMGVTIINKYMIKI